MAVVRGVNKRGEFDLRQGFLSNNEIPPSAMKRVRNRRLYDTENATQVAQVMPDAGVSDISTCRETLYETADGEYFLHREEWRTDAYVIVSDEMEPTAESITLLTEEEALEWCEIRRCEVL